MKHLLGNESIINKSLCVLAVITSLLISSGSAWADTVAFSPDTSNVGVGEIFNVDIVGDFTELAGGVIDLGFDSAAVQINSVTIDPYFDFLPDGGGPSTGDTWQGIGFDVLANDPATGIFTIATINITALVPGTSNLTILGTSEFFSATAQLFPTVNSGTIATVPIPAAAWLFGSGLIGLIGIARRKKSYLY